MEKKIDFNDYEWHDAVLKDLHIDRSNPGHNDTISMDIVWPDETKSIIIFEDVYKAVIDMNFGFIALESIDLAYISKDNLNQFYIPHLNLSALTCYVIEFSTSVSKIKIIAKNFRVQ